MPQQNGPVTPSPSFLESLQKWLGYGPLPENVQQGMDIAQKQGIPTDKVQQMGPIGRFFGSAATAVATPRQNIEMNVPGMQGQSPMDVAAILAHENEHINQMKSSGRGYLGEMWHRYRDLSGIPYGQRPEEMGAYQVEKNFRRKNNQSAISIPSFSEPDKWSSVGGDVNLPLSGTPTNEVEEYKRRIARNAGINTAPSSSTLARIK